MSVSQQDFIQIILQLYKTFQILKNLLKSVEECQNKLSLLGTETLTDSDAQLLLLLMQVKCLLAELSQ